MESRGVLAAQENDRIVEDVPGGALARVLHRLHEVREPLHIVRTVTTSAILVIDDGDTCRAKMRHARRRVRPYVADLTDEFYEIRIAAEALPKSASAFTA